MMLTSKKTLTAAILATLILPAVILFSLSKLEQSETKPATDTPPVAVTSPASATPPVAATPHDHSKLLSVPPGPNVPKIKVNILSDATGGWNVHIITENFKFSPENVNEAPVDGEGHAHIFINDVKFARVYSPWFHIGKLPSGKVSIRVALNANNHQTLAVADVPLSVTTELTVN